MGQTRVKPEVMSPAGYWPQLRAAIEAGADSVYFGLKHFTARAKVGFTLPELPEVFRSLHQRGIRGFVTFNTLVFEHEWREAARAIAAIAEAGADALIIQDLGVLQLAREIVPDLELHASTQMSITDAAGVQLAVELGARRVTLARELSLDEILAVRAKTTAELEVFVHGALCVAYSGQCFSSEAWGGRSANRGQCAQACRLPYEMYVDGRHQPLGDARYLLSPEDLYALRQVPDLVDIGIHALKIEGRYKEADYVAAATQAYRRAVDDAWANRPLTISPREELELEQIYSRGAGPHFLTGTNHQTVVRGRAPRHRGILMGRVHSLTSDAVVLEPTDAQALSPLKAGDGVVFDAADWRSPEEPEEGGRVYEVVHRSGGRLELRFGRGELDWSRIRPGDWLWRTSDPALLRQLRTWTEPASPIRKQVVDVHVRLAAGEPLAARWRLRQNSQVQATVQSPEPLPTANNRAAGAVELREHFGRLGTTPYELGELLVESGAPAFVPVSLLNQLRRQAVEGLQSLQSQPPLRPIAAPVDCAERLRPFSSNTPKTAEPARLHLLVRTPEQLEAAIFLKPASITLDYLDLYGLRPSVQRLRDEGVAVRVATPRVLKPGEDRVLAFLLRLECPLLIRPAGLLHALRNRSGLECTGDFSLNAANSVTARWLLDQSLSRITPTHDLNGAQVAELARSAGPDRIEVIAYQHLPVFHTEHCVFCRFLSQGTSYLDCGRPCEKHRLELGDPQGRRHPVVADVGCRNTVFGAEAQEASRHIADWRAAGICHFRLEFVHESAGQVRAVTMAFQQAFSGAITFRQLEAELRRLAPQGSTQGSLFVPASFPELPILQ